MFKGEDICARIYACGKLYLRTISLKTKKETLKQTQLNRRELLWPSIKCPSCWNREFSAKITRDSHFLLFIHDWSNPSDSLLLMRWIMSTVTLYYAALVANLGHACIRGMPFIFTGELFSMLFNFVLAILTLSAQLSFAKTLWLTNGITEIQVFQFPLQSPPDSPAVHSLDCTLFWI